MTSLVLKTVISHLFPRSHGATDNLTNSRNKKVNLDNGVYAHAYEWVYERGCGLYYLCSTRLQAKMSGGRVHKHISSMLVQADKKNERIA